VVQKGQWFNTYVTGRLDGSTPVSDVPSDDAPAHGPVDTSTSRGERLMWATAST
jgi:hypothetical protein